MSSATLTARAVTETNAEQLLLGVDTSRMEGGAPSWRFHVMRARWVRPTRWIETESWPRGAGVVSVEATKGSRPRRAATAARNAVTSGQREMPEATV